MSLPTEAILILAGALFLLIGLLGGGIEISAIKVPTAGAPQRAILALVGVAMIVAGGKYLLMPTGSEPRQASAETTSGTTASETPASGQEASGGTPTGEGTAKTDEGAAKTDEGAAKTDDK